MTLPHVHAIAIGGIHQLPHFLPSLFELVNRGAATATVFALTGELKDEAELLARELGYPAPEVVVMRLPIWLAARLPAERRKIPALLLWHRVLRNCDLLWSAERTSTILKRLPGSCPMFIHTPHGAGDRAVGFEKRIALFDNVLVAGEKDKARLIASGRVRPNRCHVVGPVKLAVIKRISRSQASLFANDRPVVLYNPHFENSLNSFEAVADRLISAVQEDGRYNLIVAPHIRLAKSWSAKRRRKWQDRRVPDRIIVDLGSRRSINMTYTLGADLYFGDVSSQVYEFLVKPRPCLFVNARQVDWAADENYRMWRFGPVIGPDVDFIGAIDNAFATHANYVEVQKALVAETLETNPFDAEEVASADREDAVDKSARIVSQLLANAQ